MATLLSHPTHAPSVTQPTGSPTRAADWPEATREAAPRSTPPSAWAAQSVPGRSRAARPRWWGRFASPGGFIVLSCAAHAAGLAAFAHPSPAVAAAAVEQTIEVEMFQEPEPSTPEPAPEPAAPLGRLDVPLRSAPTAQAPVAVQSAASAPTDSPTSEAPKVLTASANNPYAQSSNAVFVSGSGKGGYGLVARRKVVSAPTPAFGVESGSVEATEEAKKALAAWYASVRSRLAHLAGQRYPMRARKLGQQGMVKVAVRISADGRILSTSVTGASGFSSLDDAALRGVATLSQVEAPPQGTGTTTLVVPVTYRLR